MADYLECVDGDWSLPVLNRLKHRLDHRRYNGASLVGLRGIVIKSHGSADSLAFEQALRRAHEAARNGLLERIAQAVPRLSGWISGGRGAIFIIRSIATSSY